MTVFGLRILASGVLVLVGAVACQNPATPIAAVSVEFRPTFDEPAEGLTPMVAVSSDVTIYVSDEVVLTNEDIRSATARRSDEMGPSVFVRLTEEASERFGDATEAMINKKLAILLDGEVVSAPVVRSRITTSVQITGDFSEEEAERIADGLNASTK